ncbi:TIGR03943 family putative permease subunit [Pseudalkalibacillus decolorationis]|uniref:TIGR03943 family putative permease subunit n=1 Tax=Pseudalkalibacillus decolorationis TaxID=163879 RepID=UPI00214992F5|nr:TIGR03943 family protein [Pseudalkalibacillus decolorationis]
MNHQYYIYIRSIILFGFAFLLCGLIYSGQIQYYIAPRMMKFIYFAAGTFFILGIVQLFRNEEEDGGDCHCGHDHSESKSPIRRFLIYTLFIIPLITGFTFPNKVLDSAIAQKKGVSLNGNIASQQPPASPLKETSESNTPEADAYLENPEKYMEQLEQEVSGTDEEPKLDDRATPMYDADKFYGKVASSYKDKSVVRITAENYIDVLNSMGMFLDQYIGKRIEIEGFVYRDDKLTQGQFVVARFAMSCCSADASVFGTLVKGNDLQKFTNDEWVNVQGTISKTTYNGALIPVITVHSVNKIKSPETPYVYPSDAFLNQ